MARRYELNKPKRIPARRKEVTMKGVEKKKIVRRKPAKRWRW